MWSFLTSNVKQRQIGVNVKTNVNVMSRELGVSTVSRQRTLSTLTPVPSAITSQLECSLFVSSEPKAVNNGVQHYFRKDKD